MSSTTALPRLSKIGSTLVPLKALASKNLILYCVAIALPNYAAFFYGHDPLKLHIALVPNQDDLRVGGSQLVDLFHPFLNTLKRAAVADRVREDDPLGGLLDHI